MKMESIVCEKWNICDHVVDVENEKLEKNLLGTGIEPATLPISREHSTNWANQASVKIEQVHFLINTRKYLSENVGVYFYTASFLKATGSQTSTQHIPWKESVGEI